MSSFVIDASALLAAVFREIPEERRRRLIERLSRDEALAPAHFPIEVFDTLEMARRRKSIDPAQLNQITSDLIGLAITIRPISMIAAASVRLSAEGNGLTVYDAAYLDLAMADGLELVTLDDELVAAAGRFNVPVSRP